MKSLQTENQSRKKMPSLLEEVRCDTPKSRRWLPFLDQASEALVQGEFSRPQHVQDTSLSTFFLF